MIQLRHLVVSEKNSGLGRFNGYWILEEFSRMHGVIMNKWVHFKLILMGLFFMCANHKSNTLKQLKALDVENIIFEYEQEIFHSYKTLLLFKSDQNLECDR